VTGSSDLWRPTATREVLQQRAQALARVREFFAKRAVLEVDTPLVVNAPVTDVHIHSAEVRFAAIADRHYLHTSPEFAMKRLLASGSGDIFQLCHVVRAFERGRHHNAEFTLVEWYRLGFSMEQLMEEVEALARAVLGPVAQPMRGERLSYVDAFKQTLGIDPLTASMDELTALATTDGSLPWMGGGPSRDDLLDLLMAVKIGPALGQNALTFVHRYPASQAALARLDPNDPRVALRFELYCEGIELANGFHELASASEQRARFEQDLAERRRRGQPAEKMDELLLAALESGLPECAGVAVGFDRLLMLATGASHIDQVLPFPIERA
jgi:elongation factor P--(R)-beta-lysine ligase